MLRIFNDYTFGAKEGVLGQLLNPFTDYLRPLLSFEEFGGDPGMEKYFSAEFNGIARRLHLDARRKLGGVPG